MIQTWKLVYVPALGVPIPFGSWAGQDGERILRDAFPMFLVEFQEGEARFFRKGREKDLTLSR